MVCEGSVLKVVVQKPELKSDRKWEVAELKSDRKWEVEEKDVRRCKESFMPVSTWQITTVLSSVACEGSVLEVVVQKSELRSDREWDVAGLEIGSKWDVEEMAVRRCKESFMPVSAGQTTRVRCSVACERISCEVSESLERLVSCKRTEHACTAMFSYLTKLLSADMHRSQTSTNFQE